MGERKESFSFSSSPCLSGLVSCHLRKEVASSSALTTAQSKRERRSFAGCSAFRACPSSGVRTPQVLFLFCLLFATTHLVPNLRFLKCFHPVSFCLLRASRVSVDRASSSPFLEVFWRFAFKDGWPEPRESPRPMARVRASEKDRGRGGILNHFFRSPPLCIVMGREFLLPLRSVSLC